MDYPSTLQGLCQTFDVTFQELSIACKRCRTELTFGDKAFFRLGKFSVVWKKDWPYALCQVCAREIAAHEFYFHQQEALQAEDVEEYIGCAVDEWLARCSECFRVLLPFEITDLAKQNCTVYIIRNRLHIRCILCRGGYRQSCMGRQLPCRT
ncbi:E6 [Trichechus manatus latirostris papillomavirus 2]|uniref:Protein E6 n=1 Tax=Trichechus manatus latirostris papillomavirus 2 TaxID=1144379 RepID=H6UYR2_9PAPI|nr:E6 gene product [Trichechus manatus latirostris papillomavirus 2]AFA26595.1 E6 [Trichechus manatus latirostris papillomavirus 2]